MKEPATGGSPPPRRKTPPLARKSTPPREENILCGVPGTNPVRRLESGAPLSLSIDAGSAHKKSSDLLNQIGSMKETVCTPLQKPKTRESSLSSEDARDVRTKEVVPIVTTRLSVDRSDAHGSGFHKECGLKSDSVGKGKPNRKNGKGGSIDDALSQMIGALQIVNDSRIVGDSCADRKRRKREAFNAKKSRKRSVWRDVGDTPTVSLESVSEVGSHIESESGAHKAPGPGLFGESTSIQTEASLADELRWMIIPTMDPGVNTRTWVEFLGAGCILEPIRSVFGFDPFMLPMDAMDTNHQTCRHAGISWLESRSMSYAHRLGYRYTRRGQIYQNLLDHLFSTNVHTKVTTQRLQALSFSASTFLQTTYKNQVYDYDVMLNTVQLVAVKIRVYNLSLGSGVAAPDGEYAALTTR